ncbi:TrmB family transcriptional regulator [Haloarcula marina]|uniref:TrmB family transcriptional regulator n=1 Tax=Haloarcula marina TaxID=2961574 RepID=UPI0020B82BBC|nr:TrmB family transcriptional regulator sugar-binding domain-containing protein [Halomicroarcula marina]
MTTDALREHLGTFGLSEKEIAAYLAILRAGEATTGEVSRAADVSQGYVYDIASALADRGLVAIDETASPTVLRAQPPEEAVESLSARLAEVGDHIETLYAEPESDGAAVEVVHSRATVRKRAKSAIDAAEHEAFLTIPFPELDHLSASLAAARDRGVFVYLLLVSPLDDPDGIAWETVADVGKTWGMPGPVHVVVDRRRGLMGSHGVLSGRHGSEYALGFDQRDIAGAFYGNAVSNFWPMGETQYVRDPDPLPATYTFFRTAVTNAALHRAAGRDLLADVTLRDVTTDETATYERVPIVDVRQRLVGDPTNEFPIENSLEFETPDGRLAAGNGGGGIVPFYEGYAAESVTLYEA